MSSLFLLPRMTEVPHGTVESDIAERGKTRLDLTVGTHLMGWNWSVPLEPGVYDLCTRELGGRATRA